jgi:hypothetical protein
MRTSHARAEGAAALVLATALTVGLAGMPAGAGASVAGRTRPAAAAAASTGTVLPGTTCPVFPADNVWNTDISGLPVDPNSATWLASMDSATTDLHPDYGPSGDPSVPYGIPYQVVSPSTPLVNITFEYADQSDPGPYPFSASTPIEGGSESTGDRHAIMVNPATCTLYELWDAYYSPSGSTAGSGAIWDLGSNALRPAGWTSADAAGLPILPGLVNYDEVASGTMDHAIRFTAQCTQEAYIWPARHEAGQADPACPPMGARFRLDADFSLPASSCDAMCQTVLTTMKDYGLILADNGSNWFFQGVADTRWTDTEVDELKQIPASAFQAVDESCLMVNPNSGEALQPGTTAYHQSCLGAPATGSSGYDLAGSDGGVFVFPTGQSSGFYGSLPGLGVHVHDIVGIVPTDNDTGYDLVGSDGGVFVFPTGQDAGFYGSLPGLGVHVNDIVGIVPTANDSGYDLVGSDGGVFVFPTGQSSGFYGSLPGLGVHASDIVSIVASPDGGGYSLVGRDGGVFTFGDAPFFGSLPGLGVTVDDITSIASTPDGKGYYLVSANGAVYAFGDAAFDGSLPGIGITVSDIVSIVPTPDGGGYWLIGADGGVFAFGDAPSQGSLPGLGVNVDDIVGAVPTG